MKANSVVYALCYGYEYIYHSSRATNILRNATESGERHCIHNDNYDELIN